MSEFLTVRLSNQKEATVPWLVWSTQQQEVIASGELANWDQLPDLAAYAVQRTTIVLLSASDTVLTQVEIPAGASRQLETMLPYLVEEELAQDADDLHFAVLNKRGDKASVAGVDRHWLRFCLQELRQIGIEVRKVMPDVLALPVEEGGLSAVQLGSDWLVRKGEYQGICVDSEWLAMLGLSEWGREGEHPLPLKSYSPLPELALTEGAEWTEAEPQLVMAMLTRNVIASKINLLCGEFKPKSSLSKYWIVWKKCAVAAGFLLAVAMGYNLLQAHQYEKQAEAYHNESERIFRAIFPDKQRIPTVSYLKREMTAEAQRLSGGGSETSMLEWIAKLPVTIGTVGTIQLTSLKYDGSRGEVRLEARSPDFQSFEQARVKLEQQFVVEQGQLNRNGEAVFGTFVLRQK